jgi:NADH-quinone oxidoreductase subunit G/NADP-reducing hydrogenase subunit HndD
MVVHTNTPAIREARRVIVELMLSRHPQDCLMCERNLNCELQAIAEQLGIRKVRFDHEPRGIPIDESTPSLVRDMDKCILCRRCVATCEEVQAATVLFPINRGADTMIATAAGNDLVEVACALCGQCLNVCPTGAIREKDDTEKVWDALGNPNKHVVVQTAPAIRVSISEEMGIPPGEVSTGKLVAGLRRLGFDRVFDTDFTADLTIIEEGHELLHRLQSGGTLPMITSCSPGWIKFIEHFYPHLLDHLSTCKSPQQMFGALAKTYYAEKFGIDPASIYVVSIMPCTAKKFEAVRPEMNDSGFQDVDAVLTTRELGRMFRSAGVDFGDIEEADYDAPFGITTGAGAIFGNTGGVMEAALRTVYEVVTGETLEKLNFDSVRGLEGIKEATVMVGELPVKVAVAHGLGNAKELLDLINSGKADYHFIEIMACPGGCIGGGGQPIPTTNEIREKRIAALYAADEAMTIRKSHENPAVKALYDEFLKEPLGEKSHHLLHTHYEKRSRFKK